MKNILFLSSWFPNKLEPANGNFVQRHAEAAALLHKVEILHVIAAEQQEMFVFDDKMVNGIRTLIIFYRKSGSVFFNLYRKFSAYKKGFHKMQRPDLVHGNILQNNMLFCLYLKQQYQIPYVISEHWSGFLEVNRSKLSFIKLYTARIIAQKAAFILPVSHNLKKNLEYLSIGKNHQVIGNSVNMEVFMPIKPAVKSDFTFLHLSNLVPLKNADKIILTAVKLHSEFPDFKLQIGGDGDVTRLDQFIADHQAAHYISTFTALSSAEVAAKMQVAGCFLLFSDYENLPCVLLESLACGTPVVATDVGGVSEFVNPDNGILIKNKEQELYDAMKAMLLGKSFSPETLSQEIGLKYSDIQIANQFSAVYDRVLNAAP